MTKDTIQKILKICFAKRYKCEKVGRLLNKIKFRKKHSIDKTSRSHFFRHFVYKFAILEMLSIQFFQFRCSLEGHVNILK